MKNEDLNKINITSPNLLDERLAVLKRLFPDLFDGNGNLSEKELKDLLSGYTTPQVEKFTFEWGGKSASKKLAFTPSKATLVPVKNRSINFDESQNIIIEGDNLHVLKLLQYSYTDKIKCIYIDPPYNTGKDFIYPDNYRETEKEYWEKNGQVHDGIKLDSNFESNGRLHSSWLSMMQSRLLLAKRLLRNDGVIFVSIDDNEVHNLRKLLDEVFGVENFLAMFLWKSRQTTDSRKASRISTDHEYIIAYAKDYMETCLKGNHIDITKYTNPDNDPRGDWASIDLSVQATKDQRPNQFYDIIDPVTGNVYPPNPNRVWSKSKDVVDRMIKEGRILFPSKLEGRPREKKFLADLNSETTGFSTWLDNKIVGYTTNGTRDLSELFGDRIFDFPKPIQLLEELFKQATDESDIILDFFAGSGTTGHAVMQLNKDDHKNRRFILVQIPEYTEIDSEMYKAGFKTISDITIERVKKAGEVISKEDDAVDTGFKLFKQTYSHFPENTWKPDSTKTNEENQKAFKEYLDNSKVRSLKLFNDFEFEPVLYEILLKQGFELTFEIVKSEKFNKNEVYKAKDSEKETLICLDQLLEQVTVDELIENHTKDRFICIENALDTTNKWKLSKALGKNLEVVG